MNIIKLSTIIFIFCLLFSCSRKNENYIPFHEEVSYNIISDIVYKKTIQEDLKLDLYLPTSENKEKPSVLIFIHGGAWTFGDKMMIQTYYRQFILDELLKNNIAVISIDYSLLNDSIHFPQPIADCKDAVKWVKKNADQYQLDTTKIGLWGSSAGAHLALLAAYYPENKIPTDSSYIGYSSSVDYIIDHFGPTDLNKLFRTRLGKLRFLKWVAPEIYDIRTSSIQHITGFDFLTNKELAKEKCKEYSPIQYISNNALPTLIMHGDKDEVVALKQTKKLIKSLNSSNANYTFKEYHGLNHGFKNAHEEQIQTITSDFLQFVLTQLSILEKQY